MRDYFVIFMIFTLSIFFSSTSSFAAEEVQKPTKNLYRSVLDGDIEQVKLNLSQGADINEKDRDGQTPVHLALSYGQTAIAKLLIDQGADINAVNKIGQTPLHIASFKGNIEAVNYLVAKEGLNVDPKDSRDQTPLQFAAEFGYKDIVERLIISGADVNAQNIQQQNALSLAKKKGHKEIEELLLKHGAKEPEVSVGRGDLHPGYGPDGRPNLYGDLTSGERITAQEQTVTQSSTQMDVTTDPNEVKERISKFEGLQQALDKLQNMSEEEHRSWLQRRFDNRTSLIKDVQSQFEAELTLVRKLAVDEQAQKTVGEIDKLLETRKQRFEEIRKSIREERREERQNEMQRGRSGRYTGRSSRRASARDSRSSTPYGADTEEMYSGRYSHRTTRDRLDEADEQDEQIDTQTQNEIRDWLQSTPENKLRLAESVHKQLTAELTSIRSVASEEEAEKTIAAIDGLLLQRQQRFTKIVQTIEEENRKAEQERGDASEGRRGRDTTSRRYRQRGTRGRYGSEYDQQQQSDYRSRRRR